MLIGSCHQSSVVQSLPKIRPVDYRWTLRSPILVARSEESTHITWLNLELYCYCWIWGGHGDYRNTTYPSPCTYCFNPFFAENHVSKIIKKSRAGCSIALSHANSLIINFSVTALMKSARGGHSFSVT